MATMLQVLRVVDNNGAGHITVKNFRARQKRPAILSEKTGVLYHETNDLPINQRNESGPPLYKRAKTGTLCRRPKNLERKVRTNNSVLLEIL